MSEILNFTISRLAKTGSTNTFLKDLAAKEYLTEGTVIMADYQSSGRGQGSNRWYSSAGNNLTLSILFLPKIPFIHHFALAEFVSLAIIDLLSYYGIDALVKWPNDIYVEDKKIAGILIENILTQDKISQTIAGIGLNINEDHFPEDLPNPVSLRQITGKDYQPEQELGKLLNAVESRYRQINENDYDGLHNEYNSKLYLRGVQSKFRKDSKLFPATIIEVKTSGELMLKMQSGETGNFLFGEIQYIF